MPVIGRRNRKAIFSGLDGIEEVWDRGYALAQDFLNEYLTPEPIQNLEEAARVTAESEEAMRDALVALAQLEASGHAQASDYATYNQIQENLVRAQTNILVATRRVFRSRPDVLARLPVKVRKAPRIAPPSSLSGFGTLSAVPAVTAVAAAPATATALAPWMIVALIIAALVTVGLLAYLAATTVGLTAESIRDVLVVKSQSDAYRSMVEGRLRIFNDCINDGGTVNECSVEAQDAIPSPVDAAAPLPSPAGAWVKWVVAGIIAVGGFWIYKDIQDRRDRVTFPESS